LENEFFSTKAGLGRWVPSFQSQFSDQQETSDSVLPEVRKSSIDGDPEQAKWRNGFDLCPFTVLETVPLSKVHFMFAVLGLSHAWVVKHGRLVGVITKKDLMTFK